MKPIIGITMGDAAGVGPEIIAKALSLKEIYDDCKPLVIGDADVMKEAVRIANVRLDVNPISSPKMAKFNYGSIDILDLGNIDLSRLKMGEPNPMCGKASVEYIEKAVSLAMRGEIDAIATAPISKEAINMAGYNYPGHTELLAHLTRARDYAMMLIADNLRVSHVTTHTSLREAINQIKKERILKVIKLTHNTLKVLGIKNPKIAVAGLNPHSGEGGLFGREEIEEITPAIEKARRMGMRVEGPIPADTVFVRARGGAYDAVVAMYHDQGHIPVKLIGLEWDERSGSWIRVSGINMTMGLPIIRTSVDHGTAYGKAGKGTANPESMIEAIKFASKLSRLSH